MAKRENGLVMDILFFGRLSDAAQNISGAKPVGVVDTDSLIKWLSDNQEGLGQELAKAGNRIAVNKVIVTDNTPLNNNDEVAFMSPLSGG